MSDNEIRQTNSGSSDTYATSTITYEAYTVITSVALNKPLPAVSAGSEVNEAYSNGNQLNTSYDTYETYLENNNQNALNLKSKANYSRRCKTVTAVVVGLLLLSIGLAVGLMKKPRDKSTTTNKTPVSNTITTASSNTVTPSAITDPTTKAITSSTKSPTITSADSSSSVLTENTTTTSTITTTALSTTAIHTNTTTPTVPFGTTTTSVVLPQSETNQVMVLFATEPKNYAEPGTRHLKGLHTADYQLSGKGQAKLY